MPQINRQVAGARQGTPGTARSWSYCPADAAEPLLTNFHQRIGHLTVDDRETVIGFEGGLKEHHIIASVLHYP